MPILDLRSDAAQICTKYSIVGNYVTPPFVRHAALLKADMPLRLGAGHVPVWHMGPPLVAGTKTTEAAPEQSRTTTVHLVGYLDLDADDIKGIETWRAEVDQEDRPSPTSLSRWPEVFAQTNPEQSLPLAREAGKCGFFCMFASWSDDSLDHRIA